MVTERSIGKMQEVPFLKVLITKDSPRLPELKLVLVELALEKNGVLILGSLYFS